MRLGLPSTMARTRWTLGFQRRFVRRCEWLMRIPNRGFLPHTSPAAAIGPPSEGWGTAKDSNDNPGAPNVTAVTSAGVVATLPTAAAGAGPCDGHQRSTE